MPRQTLTRPQQAPTLEALYTFKNAMDYLRVSRSTMWRLMQSGQLVGHKVGVQWRFELRQLKACVMPAEQKVK